MSKIKLNKNLVFVVREWGKVQLEDLYAILLIKMLAQPSGINVVTATDNEAIAYANDVFTISINCGVPANLCIDVREHRLLTAVDVAAAYVESNGEDDQQVVDHIAKSITLYDTPDKTAIDFFRYDAIQALEVMQNRIQDEIAHANNFDRLYATFCKDATGSLNIVGSGGQYCGFPTGVIMSEQIIDAPLDTIHDLLEREYFVFVEQHHNYPVLVACRVKATDGVCKWVVASFMRYDKACYEILKEYEYKDITVDSCSESEQLVTVSTPNVSLFAMWLINTASGLLVKYGCKVTPTIKPMVKSEPVYTRFMDVTHAAHETAREELRATMCDTAYPEIVITAEPELVALIPEALRDASTGRDGGLVQSEFHNYLQPAFEEFKTIVNKRIQEMDREPEADDAHVMEFIEIISKEQDQVAMGELSNSGYPITCVANHVDKLPMFMCKIHAYGTMVLPISVCTIMLDGKPYEFAAALYKSSHAGRAHLRAIYMHKMSGLSITDWSFGIVDEAAIEVYATSGQVKLAGEQTDIDEELMLTLTATDDVQTVMQAIDNTVKVRDKTKYFYKLRQLTHGNLVAQ